MTARPFHTIARRLRCDPSLVIALLTRLQQAGTVSRVGPVFRPNTIGVSTLAAVSVPQRKLLEVAALISTRPEVNHNYEREHRFNLWFVVNALSPILRDAVVAEIEREIGLPVMSLPLLRDYHIDLGFKIDFDSADLWMGRRASVTDGGETEPPAVRNVAASRGRSDLIAAIQAGLPLTERPFAAVGERIGISEASTIDQVRTLVDARIIKRFGIIVRHRELGYRANAMAVWNVPDHDVDELGAHMARASAVTLCYRRLRCLPDWPYNLFCMVHGKDREMVLDHIQRLSRRFALGAFEHAVLFSNRRFKQRGAYYRPMFDNSPAGSIAYG